MNEPPRYRPYRNAAAAFQIGLKPFDPKAWLDVGPGYGAYMPQKRARLTGDVPRYYRSLPRSLPAQQELLTMIVDHLCTDHAANFGLADGRLQCRIDGLSHDLGQEGVEPLYLLSQFIMEDFVILDEVEGRMILTAAANAYTSSGRIIASVGGAMPFAHHPVPGLNDQLGPRIDRILSNLKEGVMAERFNWLLTALGALLFPPDSHASNLAASAQVAKILAADPTRCGELLWIRAERQALVKLPASGAVAFSIHTYSDPLAAIADDRESLEGMRDALASYSTERLAYSAMTETRDPVLRWIDRRLARMDEL